MDTEQLRKDLKKKKQNVDYASLPFNAGILCIPRGLSALYSIDQVMPLQKHSYGMIWLIPSNDAILQHLAVKMVDINKLMSSEVATKRLLRELMMLHVRHENLATPVAACTSDLDSLELATIYVLTPHFGRTLREVINHRFTMRDIRRLVTEMLRALKYLHSITVSFEGDLRPESMYCDMNGKLLLSVPTEINCDEEQKRVGIASSPYQPIETTISWIGKYDERTDIWSVGLILCEMLSGTWLVNRDLSLAIDIFGPVPDCVLNKIQDTNLWRSLKAKSETAQRRNLLKCMTGYYARPLMREEIRSNKNGLEEFVERTLQFDLKQRMSVDEALAHPFLSECFDATKNVVGSPIVMGSPQSPEGWKQLIWDELQKAPKFPPETSDTPSSSGTSHMPTSSTR